MRTFILILFLCQSACAKDKFYGEYAEMQVQTKECASTLSYLARKAKFVAIGSVVLALGGAFGVSVLTLGEAISADSKIGRVTRSVKATDLPIRNQTLRRETADKIADLLLLKLSVEGTREVDRKREEVLAFLKKHVWVWHHGDGEKLAQLVRKRRVYFWHHSGNRYGGLRNLLREAIYEELGSDDADWSSAAGFDLEFFDRDWSPVDFDEGAARSRKDLTRILALPAHTNQDPTGYRDLVAEQLTHLDRDANLRDQGAGSILIENIFGAREAKRYVKHAKEKMDGVASLKDIQRALTNADPGSTIGQAMEKADLKFYIDGKNPLVEFKPVAEHPTP